MADDPVTGKAARDQQVASLGSLYALDKGEINVLRDSVTPVRTMSYVKLNQLFLEFST